MTAQPDCDRNLRFGVVALHLKMITAHQFAEACSAWHVRATGSLADLLAERGWLTTAQRDAVEGLLGGTPTHPAGEALPPTIDVRAGDHDRYAPLRYHASGSMGDVWLARDRQLGRDVAMKKLRFEHAFDPARRSRFAQEALITGQLDHPGVVPVYELSCPADGDLPFYAMRFVRGRTLADAARAYHERRREGREEPFELPALLTAFVTVCNTVGYAHSQGVLHRDLKPANVVLGDFGEAVVLDWGLAKRLRQQDDESAGVPGAVADGESDVTRLGDVIGTPAYMAPEQAAGRHDLVDERTDVYGLGAILYAVLTGRPPFDGRDVAEVLRQVQHREPPPLTSAWPDVPPGLEAICRRALAKDRAARWASATELGQEVQGWQEAQRRQAVEALERSEALYRATIDAIPQMVWIIKPDGQVDYFNRRATEYTGLAPGELGSILGAAATVHQEDQAVMLNALKESLAAGTPFEAEYRIRRADGDFRWHLARAVQVQSAEGQTLLWFGTCTDIHDQKRTEEELRHSREALRRSEAMYRAIIDAVPTMVWTADPDGRVDFHNRRAYEFTGQSPGRVDPNAWPQFAHPDDMARVQQSWADAVASGQAHEIAYRIRAADGSYRRFLVRAVPVRDDHGRIIKWFGTSTDIEDTRHAPPGDS